jgi:hypothetical protein
VGGFLGGFAFSLLIAFGYFFGTDRKIYRKMATDFTTANQKYERASRMIKNSKIEKGEMRIDWFLSATFGIAQSQEIQKHYSQEFLNSVFKRHHVAAVAGCFYCTYCFGINRPFYGKPILPDSCRSKYYFIFHDINSCSRCPFSFF